jgi:hypothetical protein
MPVRSAIFAFVTACFALSAFMWGSMPGCINPADAVEAHAHHHSGDEGEQPSSTKCVVHLCCVQLASPGSVLVIPDHVSAPESSAGFVAAGGYIPVRPSHILPLAHAPPTVV